MREKLTASIAIILLVCAGHACSMLRPKRPSSLITLEIDAAAPDREAAVKQTVAIIESRLDLIGISNVEVKPQGGPTEGRILVSLPDVPDLERIKNVITAGGRLELMAVVSPPSPAAVPTFNTKEEAVASLGGTIPPNRKVLPYSERDEPTAGGATPDGVKKPKQWVVLEWPPVVDGRDLRNAAATQARAGGEDYQIQFSLKPTGAEKLGAWTGANINQYMGVVLNDEVKSIAYIKGQIFDQGEISGRFSKQSAEDLALVLKSGALPAPVKIVSEGVNK